MPAAKIFTMGIISGCHIAMGALLAVTVGGSCPGLASTNPGLQKILFGAFGKREYVLNLVLLFTWSTTVHIYNMLRKLSVRLV